MKLNDLLSGLDYELVEGTIDQEIRTVAYDSRKALPGSLFVCIHGFSTDGHLYAQAAVDNGAICLVTNKPIQVIGDVTIIRVVNSRYALAAISAAWFHHPSDNMDIIGVTGTKGKTTTAYMIREILEKSGHHTGLIGTVANCIGSERIPARRTTPESYDLQELFEKMRDQSVQSVAMEVSSQGLKLHRVDFIKFKVGIFTNFSHDHIGGAEHPDMEDYFASKMLLFSRCETGIVNADIEEVGAVLSAATCKILTYGVKKPADIRAESIVTHQDSVTFHVVTPWFDTDVTVSAPGLFNVYNALAAITACGCLGVDEKAVIEGLASIQVPGRAEVVHTPTKPYTVMIDYAHTPDSLENILRSVREFTAGRLICLFGCGGDRDRTKRPEMGKISGRYADYSILTSDNPRTEDPAKILQEIEDGISEQNAEYTVIIDRTEAIRHALRIGLAGDVIVLAGKGHETYQMFKDKTIHYDEREIVEELVKELIVD